MDPIDRAAFAELQSTAGADFVVELVQTFFEEAPPMIGCAVHSRRATPSAFVAPHIR
jgi:hypothetical protein